MAGSLDEKIRQTQSSFPAQPTGSVTPCPLKKAAPGTVPPRSPVEVKTDFALTQQIMQTIGAGGGARPKEKQKEKKAWIEILLVDAEGQPMPGVRYRITTPDGQVKEGRLNQYGQAGVYEIDPGNCKITFPDLDKEAWD